MIRRLGGAVTFVIDSRLLIYQVCFRKYQVLNQDPAIAVIRSRGVFSVSFWPTDSSPPRLDLRCRHHHKIARDETRSMPLQCDRRRDTCLYSAVEGVLLGPK